MRKEMFIIVTILVLLVASVFIVGAGCQKNGENQTGTNGSENQSNNQFNCSLKKDILTPQKLIQAGYSSSDTNVCNYVPGGLCNKTEELNIKYDGPHICKINGGIASDYPSPEVYISKCHFTINIFEYDSIEYMADISKYHKYCQSDPNKWIRTDEFGNKSYELMNCAGYFEIKFVSNKILVEIDGMMSNCPNPLEKAKAIARLIDSQI